MHLLRCAHRPPAARNGASSVPRALPAVDVQHTETPRIRRSVLRPRVREHALRVYSRGVSRDSEGGVLWNDELSGARCCQFMAPNLLNSLTSVAAGSDFGPTLGESRARVHGRVIQEVRAMRQRPQTRVHVLCAVLLLLATVRPLFGQSSSPPAGPPEIAGASQQPEPQVPDDLGFRFQGLPALRLRGRRRRKGPAALPGSTRRLQVSSGQRGGDLPRDRVPVRRELRGREARLLRHAREDCVRDADIANQHLRHDVFAPRSVRGGAARVGSAAGGHLLGG